MTIPLERKNAVMHTETFLYDLLDPKKTPKVPKSVRAHASHLLRHYPTKSDMDIIAEREDNNTQSLNVKVFGNGVW